jgi:diguanylate cyclase (GGDEF)-like protein
MHLFTPDNRNLLKGCSDRYYKWVTTHIVVPTDKNLGHVPRTLIDFQKNISSLDHRLATYSDFTQSIVVEHFPDQEKKIIKRVVLFEKLALSERFEEQIKQTNNSEIRQELEAPLQKLKSLMNGTWFNKTKPIRTPKLTDYLTVEQSERNLSVTLAERVFDEKFHILIAPQLFLKDLSYYREHCGLRENSVCIGFIDIDNFKQFNSENGETMVDREVLPRFMACLEAHVYARGFAYRYGGDEYSMILPNADLDEAVNFLNKLKEKLSNIDYGSISGNPPDVTCGLFEIREDTPLTNSECLGLAEKAKNEGKLKSRGSIWICDYDSVGNETFRQG